MDPLEGTLAAACVHGYPPAVCAICSACTRHGRSNCRECAAHRASPRPQGSDLPGNHPIPDRREHVAAPRCPNPACGEVLEFGAFHEHEDHAGGSELFDRRELARRARLRVARDRGPSYPAYVVFRNHDLDRFATAWPTNVDDLRRVFGRAAAEAWGEELLEAIDAVAVEPADLTSRRMSISGDDAVAAIEVLVPLTRGVHGRTGEVLPVDHILRDPDVARSMIVAVESLRRVADSRARGASAGKRWSADDDAALVAGFRASIPASELAERFGRSELAVTSRLVKFGLLAPEAVSGRLPNAPPRGAPYADADGRASEGDGGSAAQAPARG